MNARQRDRLRFFAELNDNVDEEELAILQQELSNPVIKETDTMGTTLTYYGIEGLALCLSLLAGVDGKLIKLEVFEVLKDNGDLLPDPVTETLKVTAAMFLTEMYQGKSNREFVELIDGTLQLLP